ncbi:MAG TPA: nitrogen fixation protein NifB, partial [Geobacteraceae bacterium]|nr:nitrogen fixation protein NifB [Geobacteraceae bacterium]
MATKCNQRGNIQGHPCFGGNHHKNGRIHLAVAPKCNIKCGYCTRRHDCANESRPGVTSRILTPQEALD